MPMVADISTSLLCDNCPFSCLPVDLIRSSLFTPDNVADARHLQRVLVCLCLYYFFAFLFHSGKCFKPLGDPVSIGLVETR